MHDFYPVSLEKPLKDMDGPAMMPHNMDKVCPSLYLEWPGDYDLPQSGELTVRFRKRSETNKMDDDGDVKRQMVELDITDILGVKADKSEKKENPGDSLDKYREEAMEKD